MTTPTPTQTTDCPECESGQRDLFAHTLDAQCPAHLDFIEQAFEVAESLQRLYTLWMAVDQSGAHYAKGYPFGSSLDEVAFAAAQWALDLTALSDPD